MICLNFALHFIIPLFGFLFKECAVFFGKNAMFFLVFETEKRHGNSCLLKSHFSVDKKRQNDADDTCNGKADRQAKL